MCWVGSGQKAQAKTWTLGGKFPKSSKALMKVERITISYLDLIIQLKEAPATILNDNNNLSLCIYLLILKYYIIPLWFWLQLNLGQILQVCDILCNSQCRVLSENQILSNHAFKTLQHLNYIPFEAVTVHADGNPHRWESPFTGYWWCHNGQVIMCKRCPNGVMITIDLQCMQHVFNTSIWQIKKWLITSGVFTHFPHRIGQTHAFQM